MCMHLEVPHYYSNVATTFELVTHTSTHAVVMGTTIHVVVDMHSYKTISPLHVSLHRWSVVSLETCIATSQGRTYKIETPTRHTKHSPHSVSYRGWGALGFPTP